MRTALRAPAIVLVVALVPLPCTARSILDDPGRRDLLLGGPSVRDGSLGAFVNPASWGTTVDADVAFWWNDVSVERNSLDNAGLSLGGPIGLSIQRFTVPHAEGHRRVQETQLGVAGGNRRGHFGVSWRWAGGADEQLDRESGPVLGAILRSRRVSWGIASFLSSESSDKDAVVDIGVRPFKSPAFALFADYSLRSHERPDDGVWSAGVGFRLLHGVHLGVRVADGPDEDPSFVAQVGLYGRGIGGEVLTGFDDDADRGASTMIVRAHHPVRPIVERGFGRKHRVAVVDLENCSLAYQKDLWFDDESVPWLALARRLREIERDPDIDALAVNLAGARVRPSFAWELREAFLAIRRAGKEIVVHLDRASMLLVYVASAADRVTIDPVGSMRIPGIAMQRTYFAGLLEKLGLGFEELREFEYKSALESLSRTTMSEADREQYGRLVDVIYEAMRDGISRGRGMKPEEFDAAVEEEGILMPAQAVERGLADATGRWSDLEDAFEKDGAELEKVDWRDSMSSRFAKEERWGRPPSIAVVYAEGVCAMDSGIEGRAMAKHLQELAEDSDVRAIVLRADSPGGDPLPADLVASGLAACRNAKKPVVASQGDVAASGGYLIGLESDRLLTTPLTITGSIGVIAAWVWDAGIGAKTGVSADGVQRGSHADLFAGLRVPVIDARLPARGLRDDERAMARETIHEMYDAFVSRVATARHRTEAEIEEVAQGRVWMGEDAILRGLCDDMGGLLDAVDGAALRAGIPPDEERTIEQYPPQRRFRLPRALTPLASASPPAAPEDWSLRALRLFARSGGVPLLVLPPDALPGDWDPIP